MKLLNKPQWLLYIILGGTLCACVSNKPTFPKQLHRPLAESFAYERASSIAQVIPMKIGRFVLESAKAREAMVTLSLRAVNIAEKDPIAVMSEVTAIAEGFCYDKKSALIIQQGVTYNIVAKNMNKAHLLNALVSDETCTSKKFIVSATSESQDY